VKKFVLFCTTAMLSSAAFAQSTGTVTTEIVVTGKKAPNGVAGVVNPRGVKSRGELTQEFIAKQRPGQSINDTINMLPGVSFQNNDPYGSSGGTLTIRGFDASRISETFDGIPLNDTGNYALYSNQLLDPELIERADVNLGTTDVDSPTAAATGSTVNFRSINPTADPHVRMVASAGSWAFRRIFGLVNTGTLTSFGTTAWVAGSYETNENPYQRRSATHKQQYNAKIYQPLGNSGDFVSISGHWNANRNGNFSSIPLRLDTTQSATNPAPRVVGSGSGNRFPMTRGERDYKIPKCTVAAATPGVRDVPNSCGTTFDESFNPSNTGNIRINSRFTVAQNLILTVDPSFQYVRANGGIGAVKANEGFFNLGGTPIFGYIGGQGYYGGVDLNNDGDTLDQVELYAPSETETHRYGVISNLIWTLAPEQTFRVNYTLDYGHHRQTGEAALLDQNGRTTQYFPINKPLSSVNGDLIEKRDRVSLAILNQVSAEYNGRFGALAVDVGARLPFFKRDLNNHCVTESGGTFVDCFNDSASQAAFLAAHPAYVAPLERIFKYHKLLPTAGVSYDLSNHTSLYASYSKGMQVPGTDNLYQSLGYAAGEATPQPETTDNFDVGARYTSGKVQAQLAGWYTIFKNRLASSYDPFLDITIYRNLGTVHKYGIDADISYRPIPPVTLYAFASVLKSKILDNVQTGACTAAQVTAGASTGVGTCTEVGEPIFVNGLTAGKREAGSPTYTLGGRAEWNKGPFLVGVQAKRTGPRYVNDQNIPIVPTPATPAYVVYPAHTPAYTVVDLDARVRLNGFIRGVNDQTYLQFNVTNLFDKLYVAGFSGNTSSSSIPFAYVGAPRTFSASLSVGF
jgi:iron complex outermembrane receptor protein